MRKIGLILLRVALAGFVLLPLILLILGFASHYVTDMNVMASLNSVSPRLAHFLRWLADMQLGYLRAFRGIFFSVIPAMVIVGSFFTFHEKLVATDKNRLQPPDYIWGLLLGVSVFAFVAAYVASAGSFIRSLGVVIPGFSAVAPEWRSVILWVSFALILSTSVFLHETMSRLKFDKNRTGGILIGFLLSLLFALFAVEVPLFSTLETTVDSWKYSWFRNPALSFHSASGLQYCQAPYDESGQKVNSFAPNPNGVRDDIEIIGISNVTIEKVRGEWPLDWGIYANLAHKMGSADNSITLFDISFLDNKGVYGGTACGITMECRPIEGKPPLRPQVDLLAEALEANKQIVVSDYPLETTDEARSMIENYTERLQTLNDRELLRNVKNGRLARSWAKMPLPPVQKISEKLDGIGYANILKSESGVNTQVPVVARIINQEKSGDADYNPDRDDYYYPGIDLVLAAGYYGIDPTKDIEVDFLAGTVTLNNIPEKTYKKLDMETFEEKELDIMAKPNANRQIVIPIDEYGRMNINFRGGRYCFRYREILEVTEMTPEEAGAYYRNKIALVAMYYATGVGTAKDMHLGPYGDMAGIEHHAYAINTILNQDFAHTAPPLVNLMLLLGIGLIMGLYQPRVPTGMSFVLAGVIAILFSVISLLVTFDFFSYNHILPTVLILQFVQLVAFIGFRALTEEENVKFIRRTFSKFVSHDVVEELLANPEAISLGGSKKEISVFFSDVRGFTTISEALSPEGLVSLLNEYLSEMTELIIDYRGTIDKYMGDAIMAFWGAPARNDDHAYYACVAAIAQYRALQGLQKRWSERNIPVIDIGIGINTGLAVVGNMGSSRRMDYTLMGDTVNLGSRLEGITKTYGVKICISEFTYERVKDRVYARELDLVRVKGKLEPVRIYELMGLVNEADVESLKVSHSATPAKG